MKNISLRRPAFWLHAFSSQEGGRALHGGMAAFICSLLLGAVVFAQPPAPSAPKKPVHEERLSAEPAILQPDTELIDVPTAGVMDYGGCSARTRFFSNGGVVEWVSFGVFQNLNLGASANVDRLIGTASPTQMTRPELQAKYRFYDGDRIIPAFAIGFDGQGYFYNHADRLYNQRQRGFYAMGSQEVFFPGLELHAGVNVSDFNSNSVFGAGAASYNVEDKLLLMAEWDNINRVNASRANAGIRAYIAQGFSLDFAARGIGGGGRFSDGVTRAPERIVMLKWAGSI